MVLTFRAIDKHKAHDQNDDDDDDDGDNADNDDDDTGLELTATAAED
jgi:hypothetical protein